MYVSTESAKTMLDSFLFPCLNFHPCQITTLKNIQVFNSID